MSSYQEYYNNFYSELAILDAKGNNFDKIKDIVPTLKKGSNVLDVGCGYGNVSEVFVKQECNVYGIEINDAALIELESKGINPLKIDISQDFSLDNKFDLILLLDILEHVFDPAKLLINCRKLLKDEGTMIISIPLYFDILDRLRILFTGSIISYDNLCYGKDFYRRFRSYNYDHIRFFKIKEINELLNTLDLRIRKTVFTPIWNVGGYSKIFHYLALNKLLLNWKPNLFAHSVRIVVTK